MELIEATTQVLGGLHPRQLCNQRLRFKKHLKTLRHATLVISSLYFVLMHSIYYSFSCLQACRMCLHVFQCRRKSSNSLLSILCSVSLSFPFLSFCDGFGKDLTCCFDPLFELSLLLLYSSLLPLPFSFLSVSLRVPLIPDVSL